MVSSVDYAALRIALDQLPPHVVRCDDLADTTTQADRRRIQNRLNQRALRKRKREAAKQVKSDSVLPTDDLAQEDKEMVLLGRTTSHRIKSSQTLGFWETVATAMSKTPIDYRTLLQAIEKFPIGEGETPVLLDSYKRWMHARFIYSPSPRSDTLFTLVQFNVFRAMDSNARHLLLPRTHAFDEESLSCFTDPRYIAPSDIAPPLRPTTLQRTVGHHPWIDLLPLPRMRDNIIRAGESYDEEALCNGLVGCGDGSAERMGVLVWGEAWDPAGWELSEEFMKGWGWTVDGCEELFESTNRWRKKRGMRVLELQ